MQYHMAGTNNEKKYLQSLLSAEIFAKSSLSRNICDFPSISFQMLFIAVAMNSRDRYETIGLGKIYLQQALKVSNLP